MTRKESLSIAESIVTFFEFTHECGDAAEYARSSIELIKDILDRHPKIKEAMFDIQEFAETPNYLQSIGINP